MTTPTAQHLARIEPPGGALVRQSDTSSAIVEMMREAMQRGTKPDDMGKLYDLFERIEQRDAVKQFNAALHAFQLECPLIKKTSTAKIATSTGAEFKYTYAELDEIVATIAPYLSKHGLSYTWDSDASKKDGYITVTCTLRHVAGHSIPSSFTLPTENKSAMSPQQKIGAADTFARRRTLSNVLGLTTTDDEPEARDTNPAKITEDQAKALVDLIEDSGANIVSFLAYMGVDSLIDIRAAEFKKAESSLRQKLASRRPAAPAAAP